MRLIDADRLKRSVPDTEIDIFEICGGCTLLDREQVYDIIDEQPIIDAVPVVRCKDCKWWREETDHTCRKWGGASPRNANGYCDDGERSEEI